LKTINSSPINVLSYFALNYFVNRSLWPGWAPTGNNFCATWHCWAPDIFAGFKCKHCCPRLWSCSIFSAVRLIWRFWQWRWYVPV